MSAHKPCTEVIYSDVVHQLLEKATRLDVTAEQHGPITTTEPAHARISRIEIYIRCDSVGKTGGG